MFESKHIAYLIIIGICLIGSAFFSGTETAFSTFNRIRMKKLAQNPIILIIMCILREASPWQMTHATRKAVRRSLILTH